MRLKLKTDNVVTAKLREHLNVRAGGKNKWQSSGRKHAPITQQRRMMMKYSKLMKLSAQ